MPTGERSDKPKSKSILETQREGRVHNAKYDQGPLHGIHDYFLGDCDRCGKRVYVTEFTASHEWRERGEESGTRCAMCIWAMKKIFTWREWRPEDSPLFIGHRPAILDVRGVPLTPGYRIERGTGKVSLP